LHSKSFIWYIGIAVILVVAGVTVSILGWWPTEEGERQVKLEMIIKTPNGEKNISAPSGWVTLEPDVQTLGEFLLQENIHYGSNDIKDIFNSIIAEQQKKQQVIISSVWRIEIVNGQEIMPLSSIDNYELHSGDDFRLVYERQVLDQRPLLEFPDFITYVDENDERNGVEETDYLSCFNNSAIHDWLGRYQQGLVGLPNYPNNPPICGSHIHAFPPIYQHVLPHNPDGFILDSPIDPIQVEPHILGHGMTIIHYNPNKIDDKTLQSLKQFVLENSFIFLAPYEKMDAKITITRWGMMAQLNNYDEEKLEIFQNAPYKILPPMHGSLQYYHTITNDVFN